MSTPVSLDVRAQLLALIAAYADQYPDEAETCKRLTGFVAEFDNCCSRGCVSGHVTSSAWLLDSSTSRVLLTHHRKLDIWVQLGGHMEGESSVLASALREAREESGIVAIEPLAETLFDIDIHEIPARGAEPAHLHYDCRFVLRTRDSDRFTVSDESNELRWVPLPEVTGLTSEASVIRMVRKTALL